VFYSYLACEIRDYKSKTAKVVIKTKATSKATPKANLTME
jgi:hypothetical protein